MPKIIIPTMIILDGTEQICEGATPDCHPLADGIIVEGGRVLVKFIKTDQDCPVAAWFIPADESGSYPANSATVSGAAAPFSWNFEWTNLPVLGLDAVLRIQELPATGNRGTVNFQVAVVADATGPLTDTELA